MVSPLFKADDLIRQWPGFQGLTEDMGIVHDAVTRILANDDRAAGNDQYGDSYRNTRGTTASDVLGLIVFAEGRTFLTGEAGHNSAVLLDRAEEDNLRHSGFSQEHL